MGDEIYPKMAWQATMKGKRPKGRPQQTCEGGIQKILVERGIKWNRVQLETVRHGKLFVIPFNTNQC